MARKPVPEDHDAEHAGTEDKAEKRKTRLETRADQVGAISSKVAWLFPVMLAVTAAVSVWVVVSALDLVNATVVGAPLSARLTWGIAAMFFVMFFAFAVVACNVVMFRCGAAHHALQGCFWTTTVGVLVTIASAWRFSDTYIGPPEMKRYLDATALCVGNVRTLTAVFDGFAIWAAVLVVVTSGVILANEVKEAKDLSRQLRGSKILMYCAAALLIAIVSEVGALHKWPAHEKRAVRPACSSPEVEQLFALPDKERRETIESTATAISTSIGTVASLILAAAYLPLAILLRQRAYRVVEPWERVETWLAVHGFALQPTQQLAKLFLILSPLMAGGPISYLITLLSS